MRDPGLEAAIAAVGTVTALAAAIGITKQAVSDWKRVPAERVLEVESVTGVSREKLRPDIYHRRQPYRRPAKRVGGKT